MSGTLTHNPAKVVARALRALGLGNVHTSVTWPIHVNAEPNSPDTCITVYDTAGVTLGRRHADGREIEPYGVQVRVRCDVKATGWTKANAIAVAMSEQIRNTSVTVDTTTYLLRSMSNRGTVNYIGTLEGTQLYLFTINATASIGQVA